MFVPYGYRIQKATTYTHVRTQNFVTEYDEYVCTLELDLGPTASFENSCTLDNIQKKSKVFSTEANKEM